MNHPSELLAGYVDGTLSEAERAVVDTHLSTCEACPREVADARRAREALRALPRPSAPPGLAHEALAAAATTPTPASRWNRAAGLAAAAVLVILVAVAIPRMFSSEDQGTSAAAESADAIAAAPPAGLERLDGELAPKDLEALAEERGAIAADAAQEGSIDRALRCLGRAYPDIREAMPVRVAEASFQGTAAYVGLFERGPGAGQPADTRIALAVASNDCTILSFTSAEI